MIAIVMLLVLASLAVLSYPVHAALLFRRQRALRRAWRPCAISIIVPLRGRDAGLEANLRSWLAQQLPVPWELLLCVEDEDDPAVPTLRQVLAEADGRARLLLTGPGDSLGKMHNLLHGIEHASGDLLVFLDSDARLHDPLQLARFIEPLRDLGVGLVTCYPAYRDSGSLGAALVGSAINGDVLGFMAVSGVWQGRLRLAVGTALALRRETVHRLGGLGFLRRQLLMDVTLASRVSSLGLRVHLAEEAVGVHAGELPARDALQQAHRWHVGMCRVLPPLLFVAYLARRAAMPLALLAWLATGEVPLLTAAAGFLLARTIATLHLDRRLRDPGIWRWLWLLPVVELLMCASALRALLTGTICWRGRRYRIGKRGVALAASSSPAVAEWSRR